MTDREPDAKSITESLIIPVYKNAVNIPALLEALKTVAAARKRFFEVVFVVDGSPDNSHDLLAEALPAAGFSSRLIRLSKNAGASAAIRTALRHAAGEHIAVMSADLQEPPELICGFFEALEKNSADIVFGQRIGREDSAAEMFLSRLYWGFYRRYMIKEIPSGGADVFAFNGRIKEAVLALKASPEMLVLQLFRLEARRLFLPYKRRKRQAGKSAWSLKKKIVCAAGGLLHCASYRLLFFLWLGVFGTAGALFYALAPLPSRPHPGTLFAVCALFAGFGTLVSFQLRTRGRQKEELPSIDSINDYVKKSF